jgi:hypothetical protein
MASQQYLKWKASLQLLQHDPLTGASVLEKYVCITLEVLSAMTMKISANW